VTLTRSELEEIRKQAEAEYPAECCGVVFEAPDGRRELFPCRNVQDEKHAEDPERFPRTSRHAYYVHPADNLRIQRRTVEGFRVSVIYHSHVDASRRRQAGRTWWARAGVAILGKRREDALMRWASMVLGESILRSGAYFSATDRRDATMDGQPNYPDTTYVVVEVNGGQAGEARAFRWDETVRDFVERPLVLA
jgi:proteasome lid subunit RPN8/RPN11